MRTLPLDTSALTLLAATSDPRPAQQWDDGKATGQAVNESGVPLWTVDLIASDGTAASTVRVKFPAATAPTFRVMAPVQVRALRAVLVGERLYFSAAEVAQSSEKVASS